MKSTIIYLRGLLLFVGVFFFTSCEDQLNQNPFSQLSDEQFWKTNDDANSGVIAIYDAMQRAYNQEHFYWGEFRGDSYKPGASAAGFNLSILDNALTSDFGGAINWGDLYQMIGRANLAIKNIPEISGYNPEFLAEAHFLRAMAYFDATRVWGDVPLFTEPVTALTQEAYKPRTDKTQIMNEVILPDLLKARQLMGTRSDQFRASRSSILNLLGEVYMWNKDWANAKKAFDEVESYRIFSLTNTREAWQDLFLNDFVNGVQIKRMVGPELIFSIRYNQAEDSDRSGIYGLLFAGLPSFYIADSLSEKWTQRFPTDSIAWVAKYPGIAPLQKDAFGKTFYGDFRYFDSRETNPNVLGARVAKYNKSNFNSQFDDTDIHVFRYASMLYNMAEVEAMLGNNAEAVNILNKVRNARLLPSNIKASDFSSQEALIDYILEEKQFETLGEGDRWWDLVRQNRAISLLGPVNNMRPETLVWPIFRNHLIDNPNLTQNPGYN